ncbi:histidine kinase [Bacillus sp. FJAT-50079]|uniref:histidine kinase n=1 Tax=Bacillus sp. FJAT-50079 TaxID=2833577 RepID=UPI001BC9BF88|nr:histidine kinase [Bacillus sp. FJAT-50079]MBS4209365.1 histidine kinase [Bacillus sp. FJAT-50079]
MKRLIPVIPVVIAVAIMSMWILERNFSEIDGQTRMLIAAGGTILSGVLSYFLFGSYDDKNDLPPWRNKK